MRVVTMQIVTGVISIKNILECNRKAFFSEHCNSIRDNTIREVERILDCRTDHKGYTLYRCECGATKVIGFSCKSRFCNSCGTPASEKWLKHIVARFPQSLVYKHLIFTIPLELRDFFKRHRDALRILEQSAWETVQYHFGHHHKLLPGVLSVIHTFGAQCNWNPHIHMICTCGGFTEQGVYKDISFMSYISMYRSWKHCLLRNLKAYCDGIDNSSGANETKLMNYLYSQQNDLGKNKDRFIYFGPPSRYNKIVVGYIGRYLKRPTISQARIVGYTGDSVTFNYIDKYDGDVKENTVSVNDFIGLLIQHIPNRYFHMISYHGAFTNRVKKQYLKRLLFLNKGYNGLPIISSSYEQRYLRSTGKDPLECSCGSRMRKYGIFIVGYRPIYFDTS